MEFLFFVISRVENADLHIYDAEKKEKILILILICPFRRISFAEIIRN